MFWQPIALSFEVAAAATVLCALLGVSLGLLLAHPRAPFRDALEVIFTAPMVLPPTVLGYFVLVAFGRESLLGRAWESVTGSPVVFTRTGVVLAAALGSLPLVVRSARAALESVDPALLAVAATLGAPPLRVLWTVRLPLAARGLSAGVLLAFARALGDFGLTLMVGGNIPGVTRTASMALYDALQARDEAGAHGLVAVLTATAFVALYAVHKLGARAAARG
jgi:molybdate transport system permease protein